jgi:hypothetical protein
LGREFGVVEDGGGGGEGGGGGHIFIPDIQHQAIQIRKIAEITSYNFYILLKDTIKSLVINHKFFCFF